MVLTARRRAVIAVLVSSPLAWLCWSWWEYNLRVLFYNYRNGFISCDGDWRGVTNSCTNYSRTLAWVELLLVAAVLLAAAVALARWVLQPVRDMAGTVAAFGPDSLGQRLPTEGPDDETRRLSVQINTMMDRLAAGYDAQRRFAANASHELRTPLATQRALIEVSLTSPLTPDQLDLLSRQLLATNERNERLIDGLLTLAETERGTVGSRPLRLDELVAEVVEEHRGTAGAAGLRLEAGLTPVTVLGERPLLERLVGNLLSNAVKYNQPGGWVRVGLDARGLLTVANSGPAVPAEVVPGLFEPFRRRSGERLEHGGGVGLGLTIVRSIATAHGTTATARPGPEGGLAVDVPFPPLPPHP